MQRDEAYLLRRSTESDIDLLVEFEPERIPGLPGIAGMELELSDLFGGRKVDLRTTEDLTPLFPPGSIGHGGSSI